MAIVMKEDYGPKGVDIIDDSFVVKTQAEVDEILRICQEVYAASILRQINEQQKNNQRAQK